MRFVKLIDVRVEGSLKDFIEEVAIRVGRTVSDVARDLVLIGLEVARSGGVEIVGPIGLRRPLARLDFGGNRERLGIWLDEGIASELERVFGGNMRGAARAAMRLGTVAFQPEKVRISGPFGLERPFLEVKLSGIRDKKAREALERLRRLRE